MLNNSPVIYEIGQQQPALLDLMRWHQEYLISREAYLIQLIRASTTELREVQSQLGKEQSIPKRTRPR